MADKEIKYKVTAEADTSGLEDFEDALNNLEDKTITVRPEIEAMELEEVENRIEELEQKRAEIYMGVDDTPLEEVEAELEELEARRIELTVNADSSGLDEAAEGLDNVENSADNANSALETMAGLQIAETLAQWGSQAESFAQNLDDIAISTEQLAIQTGMTDSQMTGMLNNITNATFPREEALMYVQSLDQIGVSAQNLGNSASDLDKINDAFHMGAPAVNKLGQELSVLGVDMNNVSSSFNALAYANANTVGGMENFSKFLTRFDADFNKLGLNVDQAAVAIAGATHKFGGGRAALSGMSSALKECNGDLGKLEQALGLEAGALQNASNLTGQYNGQLDQMAAKEGQHKTLTQQLAAALDDVTASFTGVLAPFSSFLGLMGQFGSAAVGANALLTLPGNLKDAATAMKNLSLATKLYSAAEAIANGVRTVATAVQAALNAVMMANPYVLVAVAILALVAALVYCYNTNEEFRNSVNQLFNDLQRLVNGDWHVVVEYAQKGADAATDTAGFLAGNDLSQGLSRMLMGDEAVDQANAEMDGFLENIKTKLHEGMDAFWNDGTQGLLGWLAELAGIDVGSYLQNFTAGFNGISASITGVIMGIQGFIMQVLQIPVFIQQAVMQGVAAFQGFVGQVAGVLGSVIGNVASFGGQLVSQLGSAARNAVSAFGSGLSGLVAECWAEFNDVLSAISDFGAQAIETARGIGEQVKQAIWNRASPGILAQETFLEMRDSKMFLEQGLADMVDITRSGSSNIMNGFNLDLNSNIGNTGSNGGTQANGVVNNFNFTFTDFIDDKEKLTDLIIKTITYEINWNNMTANRSV